MDRHYPSNETEFRQRFPGEKSIHSIPQSNAEASGSRWGLIHLEACRVILKKPSTRLNVLESYYDRAQNHFNNLPADIPASLRAVSRKDLQEYPSAQLRQMGGYFGAFYSRLADLTRMPKPEPQSQTRPRRDIHQTDHSDYVTGEGYSPLHGTESSQESSQEFQSSSYSDSTDGPVNRSDHERRVKHETVTVTMATEFISTVLDICCDQSNPNSKIEFTSAPQEYTYECPSFISTCQDDGSFFRLNKDLQYKTWYREQSSLAIVECKAQYTSWNEDEDTPHVSDNVLAQQVCEIISSKSRLFDTLGEDEESERKIPQVPCSFCFASIFLLSIHQSSMTFIYCTIDNNYIKYLQSIERPPTLPFLTVHSSSAFDLESRNHRVEAAIAIICLVYHLNDQDEL